MFGNSSGQTTALNVRDIYLDACVRLQGFELFHQPLPFARDLRYLAAWSPLVLWIPSSRVRCLGTTCPRPWNDCAIARPMARLH
jgi:hypothetical protein